MKINFRLWLSFSNRIKQTLIWNYTPMSWKGTIALAFSFSFLLLYPEKYGTTATLFFSLINPLISIHLNCLVSLSKLHLKFGWHPAIVYTDRYVSKETGKGEIPFPSICCFDPYALVLQFDSFEHNTLITP